MNHADIKGLNLMEGWEILNTFLKLDYPYKLILNTYLYIIRRVMEMMSWIFKCSDRLAGRY